VTIQVNAWKICVVSIKYWKFPQSREKIKCGGKLGITLPPEVPPPPSGLGAELGTWLQWCWPTLILHLASSPLAVPWPTEGTGGLSFFLSGVAYTQHNHCHKSGWWEHNYSFRTHETVPDRCRPGPSFWPTCHWVEFFFLSFFFGWRIPNLRWGSFFSSSGLGIFPNRTQNLTGILLTRHFIKKKIVETNQLVGTHSNVISTWQTCSQRSSMVANRAPAFHFPMRIWCIFRMIKCRGEWDLGLCTLFRYLQKEGSCTVANLDLKIFVAAKCVWNRHCVAAFSLQVTGKINRHRSHSPLPFDIENKYQIRKVTW